MYFGGNSCLYFVKNGNKRSFFAKYLIYLNLNLNPNSYEKT